MIPRTRHRSGPHSGRRAVYKLAVLRSAVMVEEVMRRLEEAAIESFRATERSGAEAEMGGALSVSVWVKSAGYLERASQILREVQAEQTFARCPTCGYDLRGHAGKATCPECGRDLTSEAPEIECPSCGERAPANFEICWNCGADVPAADGRDV